MREHLKEYIETSKTASVRGLRILLEYFHATEIFDPIVSKKIKIISVFGSARMKEGSPEYHLAYQVGQKLRDQGFAVVTGASQGVMQAVNQGAADSIARELMKQKKASSMEAARELPAYQQQLKVYSIGLKISLPFEAESNPYLGSQSTFHYFMVRKFFFATLSSGFIACEGGWGTRDELFEMLTLVQTGKSPLMPIVYISPDAAHFEQDLKHTVARHYINPNDTKLIHVVKTPDQAVKVICEFYRCVDQVIDGGNGDIILQLKKGLSEAMKKRVTAQVTRTNAFRQVHYEPKKIILRNFDYSSYGHISDIVFLLAKL